jgi:hypothetical protein
VSKKRKGISASTRWTVYARDGFCCRYCGAQAGQEGVELAIDHAVSLAEGGDERIDNLVTSCRSCNAGKGARSLKDAPTSAEIIARIHKHTANLNQQAIAISQAIEAQKSVDQMAVNLKCNAYNVHTIQMAIGEKSHITKLCQAYGPDQVLEWYRLARFKNVPEARAIKYVYGIVRHKKENVVNA